MHHRFSALLPDQPKKTMQFDIRLERSIDLTDSNANKASLLIAKVRPQHLSGVEACGQQAIHYVRAPLLLILLNKLASIVIRAQDQRSVTIRKDKVA